MIIGRGLIASAIELKFGDKNNVVFFASGFSNSNETKA
jgi:hypothetical protein